MGQIARDVRLTAIVGAPRHDRAVTSQGQAVGRAGRDGDHVRQTFGQDRLAVFVAAPGNDRSIALEREVVASFSRATLCLKPAAISITLERPAGTVA
jgi:hypothetical protein